MTHGSNYGRFYYNCRSCNRRTGVNRINWSGLTCCLGGERTCLHCFENLLSLGNGRARCRFCPQIIHIIPHF